MRGRCHRWLVRRRRRRWFVPTATVAILPITVAIFGAAAILARCFDTDGGGLGHSAIGIEDAKTMWVLVAVPVQNKSDLIILESAGNSGWFAIDQQLRSGLDVTSREVDGSAFVGVGRKGQSAVYQTRHTLSQPRQFVSRSQACWERELREQAAQGMDSV